MTIGLVLTIAILVIALFIVIQLYRNTKTKFTSELTIKSTELKKEQEEKSKQLAELDNEKNKLIIELEKFKGIISIEEEINKKESELSIIQGDAISLNKKYKKAKSIYLELERNINLYKNNLEFIELGIYEPIFGYDTSEKYKVKLSDLVDHQKQLIKEGRACHCNTNWTVGNSRTKGEAMVKQNINLALRAFNGECDKLIAKVKWNNVKLFEERIQKSFNAINRLNKSNDVHLTHEYLQLKIDELHMAYELEYKIHQEKDEQRAIRDEQREEEKALREYENARKEAELEEKQYQKALERAQKELGLVSGEELDKLNLQIAELQKNLEEAQRAKERAISRAQETKSGHVYIISNIGSFGENIYKIGMTRRLEPMDRVRELGDASVPFRFDLHALIFTENAPELETLLQKQFDDRRINKVNYRKEYFRATLEEIEQVIKEKYDKEVNFIRIPEAQEYRETQSIIKQIEHANKEKTETEIEKYPDSLF